VLTFQVLTIFANLEILGNEEKNGFFCQKYLICNGRRFLYRQRFQKLVIHFLEIRFYFAIFEIFFIIFVKLLKLAFFNL